MLNLRKWQEMTYRERLEAFANDEPEARHQVLNQSERERLKVNATGFLALGEILQASMDGGAKKTRSAKPKED